MLENIPQLGAAPRELADKMFTVFADVAGKTLDVAPFHPDRPLFERLAAAAAAGMEIGGVLSRYSSDLQHSTEAQALDCVRFAAGHKIYVPHEFVCVDEAVSGRKERRAGLDRMKALLNEKLVKILLVFKLSRLFRVAHKGIQFVQEEVIDEGLRAISISQGMDTNDKKTSKHLMYLHGMMDDMLLETIADHVRSGLGNLFDAGFVTGPLTIGYHGVEIPGGRLTKRGLPRRVPAVFEPHAELIREHFQLIRDGLPLREGLKRWVAAGGPCDSRSRGQMTAGAYRRMLSNPRYIGIWAFGRTRSEWSTKRDYAKRVEQPETEVRIVRSEDLRIVDDELFYDVQARLADKKRAHHGPKLRREPQLWDLVTDCFHCRVCDARFYQGGAHGNGMRCKNGALCPQLTVVRRTTAVKAVCDVLGALLRSDGHTIVDVIASAQQIDARSDRDLDRELAAAQRDVDVLTRRIDALTEMAGEGSREDQAEMRGRVRQAQAERAERRKALAAVQKAQSAPHKPLTPDEIRAGLGDLTEVLRRGAAGELGADVKFQAAEVFRRLVGGRIVVDVRRRAGRQRTSVLGTFTPGLAPAVAEHLGGAGDVPPADAPAVEVWLRPLPAADQLAERVHELIDVQGLGFRAAAKLLEAEGRRINNGTVFQIYRRYYEMIGRPMPPRTAARGRRPHRPDDAA